MINLTKTVHSELHDYDIKITKINDAIEFANFSTHLIKKHAANLSNYAGINNEDESLQQAKHNYSKALPNGLQTRNHYVSKIELNKVYIGYIWYHLNNDKSAKLNYLYIFNQYRGKGYSKKTMLFLESLLKNQDIKCIKLKVFSMNTVARNLYSSLGYILSEKLSSHDCIYDKKI